jgi:hypothetical protein
MKITTPKISQQVKGSFANGAILENKPVGFPQEGAQIKVDVYNWLIPLM